MAVDTAAKRRHMLNFASVSTDIVRGDSSDGIQALDQKLYLDLYRADSDDPPDTPVVSDQRQKGRMIITTRKRGRAVVTL